MNSLQDCMLSWSFHLLVPLLFCCYAIHSCWCTPMISGHALVSCVSISQWWQLSMKLFFRFYSVSFLLACNIYARRDWMLGYPCELVYALWCFSVAFGMLHLYRYQLGTWYFTNTLFFCILVKYGTLLMFFYGILSFWCFLKLLLLKLYFVAVDFLQLHTSIRISFKWHFDKWHFITWLKLHFV